MVKHQKNELKYHLHPEIDTNMIRLCTGNIIVKTILEAGLMALYTKPRVSPNITEQFGTICIENTLIEEMLEKKYEFIRDHCYYGPYMVLLPYELFKDQISINDLPRDNICTIYSMKVFIVPNLKEITVMKYD